MTDLDGAGSLVSGAGLVNPRPIGPGIDLRAIESQCFLAADLYAHGQAAGVRTTNAIVLLNKTRPLFHGSAEMRHVFSVGHAPNHFTQSGVCFHPLRQSRCVGVGHDHAAAIERFVHQARRCFLDQRQAPIQKKLAAAGQVLGPECDFIDTENAHSVSLVKQCFQFETLNRLFDDLKHRSIEIRVRLRDIGRCSEKAWTPMAKRV